MSATKYHSNRLYRTSDYGIFDTHEHNRALHDNPILCESLKKNGFLSSSPIHCVSNGGGKIKVVRGHHRLHYAKKLKIPVWFVVEGQDIDIYELEGGTTAAWNAQDFAISRARSGDKEYIALIEYQNKNKLPLKAAASLFGGQGASSHNKWSDIKTGEFQRGSQEHGDKVLRVLDACDRAGIDFSRSSAFVSAISSVLMIPEINIDRLISKMADIGARTRRVGNKMGYIAEIEKVYNYASRDRLAVSIRAEEVGVARKNSFGRRAD